MNTSGAKAPPTAGPPASSGAQPRPDAAFTLVEMTGVLAVIAVLAAMLVPKVITAVTDARVSGTVGSVNALKSATGTYLSNTGLFTNAANFDLTLVSMEYLERPFTTRLGNGSQVQVVNGPGGPNAQGYAFDGVNTNTLTAGNVVECLLSNVTIADALLLSLRIDGPALSASNALSADYRGRVTYGFNSGAGKVYIYLGHR